jgi:hypothetical protein
MKTIPQRGQSKVDAILTREHAQPLSWFLIDFGANRTYRGSAIVKGHGAITATIRAMELRLDWPIRDAHFGSYTVRAIPADQIRQIPRACRDRNLSIPAQVRRDLAKCWRVV